MKHLSWIIAFFWSLRCVSALLPGFWGIGRGASKNKLSNNNHSAQKPEKVPSNEGESTISQRKRPKSTKGGKKKKKSVKTTKTRKKRSTSSNKPLSHAKQKATSIKSQNTNVDSSSSIVSASSSADAKQTRTKKNNAVGRRKKSSAKSSKKKRVKTRGLPTKSSPSSRPPLASEQPSSSNVRGLPASSSRSQSITATTSSSARKRSKGKRVKGKKKRKKKAIPRSVAKSEQVSFVGLEIESPFNPSVSKTPKTKRRTMGGKKRRRTSRSVSNQSTEKEKDQAMLANRESMMGAALSEETAPKRKRVKSTKTGKKGKKRRKIARLESSSAGDGASKLDESKEPDDTDSRTAFLATQLLKSNEGNASVSEEECLVDPTEIVGAGDNSTLKNNINSDTEPELPSNQSTIEVYRFEHDGAILHGDQDVNKTSALDDTLNNTEAASKESESVDEDSSVSKVEVSEDAELNAAIEIADDKDDAEMQPPSMTSDTDNEEGEAKSKEQAVDSMSDLPSEEVEDGESGVHENIDKTQSSSNDGLSNSAGTPEEESLLTKTQDTSEEATQEELSEDMDNEKSIAVDDVKSDSSLKADSAIDAPQSSPELANESSTDQENMSGDQNTAIVQNETTESIVDSTNVRQDDEELEIDEDDDNDDEDDGQSVDPGSIQDGLEALDSTDSTEKNEDTEIPDQNEGDENNDPVGIENSDESEDMSENDVVDAVNISMSGGAHVPINLNSSIVVQDNEELKEKDTNVTTPEASTESPEKRLPVRVKRLTRKDLLTCKDHNSDMHISVVTWNLAEESPEEESAAFIKRFRKFGVDKKGSDFVLISGQECENIKPRRTEGRRSREYRRLMIHMLGKNYVPIAMHMLGGIQFGLFCRRDILHELELCKVADVTCGIGNVFHNKGAIGAFVQMKARNDNAPSSEIRSKSVKMLFVTAHMAAHVKNFEARDGDFWRIMTELEAQAPARFLPPRSEDSGGNVLLNHMDRIFFCGDLNYRVDLPREEAEHAVKEMLRLEEMGGQEAELDRLRTLLLRHDQLKSTIADRRAFPSFAEGKITFPPTFKFDKDTEDYDTSHKQRIPAWTDRVLFKPESTRVVEYDSVRKAMHSDHRPVHATFRTASWGKILPSKKKNGPEKRKRRVKKTKKS